MINDDKVKNIFLLKMMIFKPPLKILLIQSWQWFGAFTPRGYQYLHQLRTQEFCDFLPS